MPADDFSARYGPCALVAGAGVGLGAEYARQLAERGLDLLLIDRDAAAVEATAATLRAAHGVAVDCALVDLARPDLLAALAAPLAGREIGLLVYNAARGTVAPFLDTAPALLDTLLAVNCRAPLQLVRALAPAMVARGRGGIILMSSMAGSIGSAQIGAYAASKAFALVLADALWAELRPHGVDVLAVQPGQVRTPGWQSSQPAGDTTLPVMEPVDVVREALAALGQEPCVIPGAMNRESAALLATLPRRQAIEFLSQFTAQLVRNDR